MIMLKKYYTIFKKELINLIQIPIVNYPHSKLSNRIRTFYYKKVLQIGSNPLILNNFDIVSKDLITFGNSIQINKNVTMDASGSLGIYIGNRVLIGPGSYFRSANHSFLDDSSIIDQGWVFNKVPFEGKDYSIVIEDDVWIGANSIILSGAHIGKGSILNAGSVVSSLIPKMSIVAGNPGRVVMQRQNKGN